MSDTLDVTRYFKETTAYWDRCLQVAGVDEPNVVTAVKALKRLDGKTLSVLFDCDDERRYVVKSLIRKGVGRDLVAERIVGLIGKAMAAPVAEVALVRVDADLVEAEDSICSHFKSGICHGSLFIPGLHATGGNSYIEDPGNKERYASLAVLFHALWRTDEQLMYRTEYPRLLYSFDHEDHLPRKKVSDRNHPWYDTFTWSRESLEWYPTESPLVDLPFREYAKLSDEVLINARRRFASIGDEEIARAVASIPDEWEVIPDDCIALCQFVAFQRDRLGVV